MGKRHGSPIKRTNPSGETVWVARYTNREGRRKSAGTFRLRRDAQAAIDAAYTEDARGAPETVGAYFETWTTRHPRSARTNRTNEHRVSRVLEAEIEGRRLSAWPFRDLKRRHALALVDHMLVVQGRAQTGVVNILRSLSAMAEDAITDEIAEVNFVRGVKVRATDPRVRKRRRPVRVFSFEEMHRFARAGGRWEPLLRTFTDTGLRIGEVLPLRRADLEGEVFLVRRTAHEGVVMEGTKADHGESASGRVVPCPPSLAELIRAMPARIDTPLIFPTPRGRLWRERNFYRDVWYPAQVASGIDIRPHECRHSYVTHLRAAGIDDADLAEIAGHRVETMLARYTHPLHRSFNWVRGLIG